MKSLRQQLAEIEADRSWWQSFEREAVAQADLVRARMMLRELDEQIKELRGRL
jgi:hypothetical protein